MMRPMQIKPKRIASHQGFTLIELAIVLVIVGLLVGLGSSMVGVLTTAIKVRETKDLQDAAVQSVNSWASANNRLPDTTANGFAAVAKTPNDAWGRPFIYLYDNNLNINPTKDTICGRRSTVITMRQCLTANCATTAGTDYVDTSNVAFVVISESDDATVQTQATDGAIAASRAAMGRITVDVNNSDIVRWVTLDELRSKIGCQGAPLRIVNNELPFGAIPNPYSVTLTADGGVPFATNPSTYKWCVNNLPVGFSAPVGGIQNASCIDANEATWGATPASSGLTISFPANAAGLVSGSNQIIVVARDNADGVASPACSNANPGDNCAQKVFVLTVNPQ